MKTQIKKELHLKTMPELRRQLIDVKEALRGLNLDKEMGKIKNTSELREKRLEIAVVSTILNEKAASRKIAGVNSNEQKDIAAAAKVKVKSASAKSLADKEFVRKSQDKGGKK